MESLAYCDVESRYRAIIAARIRTKHLDEATVFDDVTTLTKEKLFADPTVAAAVAKYGEQDAIQCIVSGFPCQDVCMQPFRCFQPLYESDRNTRWSQVSTGGKRKGMGGDKTVLFKHVERLVNELRPLHCLCENVAPITSLPEVWRYVLTAFDKACAPI